MLDPTEESPALEKKSSALMRVIKAVVIVSVLIVIEMVAAAMIIPSAEETEELAKNLARAADGEALAAKTGDEEKVSMIAPGEATVEIELLTDNITRFDPETDSTLNVQFSVYGVVLAEEQAEFNKHYATNVSRIHEQIMLTLHGARTTDLSNAGLGLIKRQILEKTNRTLGRPLLREVVFTKLNFVER